MSQKVILPGMIFVLFAVTANGQFGKSLGAWGGATFTWHTYHYYSLEFDHSSIAEPGPAFGLFLESNRSAHFGLQTELSFACRGSSTRTESVTVNHLDGDRIIRNQGDAATSRYRYLSLSPLLRARTGENWIPYLVAGPRLDALLYYTTQALRPVEGRNLFLVGLVAGAGVEIPIGKSHLDIGVRYLYDISPAVRNELILVSGSGLMITAGLRWNREDPEE